MNDFKKHYEISRMTSGDFVLVFYPGYLQLYRGKAPFPMGALFQEFKTAFTEGNQGVFEILCEKLQ